MHTFPHTLSRCTPAGSAGSAILKFAAGKATCDASTGSYAIPAYETCATWKTTGAVMLALEVAADCSITIKPIGDTSCADPGAVSGQPKLVPLTSGNYAYTYNDLLIHAYYTGTKSIRTLLPTTDGGARCRGLGHGSPVVECERSSLLLSHATDSPPTVFYCLQLIHAQH